MAFQLVLASRRLSSLALTCLNMILLHPMQADIMHLTDAAVRRQLFLDVLDGTKALVSRPVAVPFPLVT